MSTTYCSTRFGSMHDPPRPALYLWEWTRPARMNVFLCAECTAVHRRAVTERPAAHHAIDAHGQPNYRIRSLTPELARTTELGP